MQTVFLELVKLSLIGSLFAAAVMLVRLLFPKTPKWIFCLLWGVVALRLICPVSIESSISLIPDRIASGQIITSVGDAYIGDVNIIRENDDAYSSALEAGRQPVYSDDGYYVVTEKDSLDVPKTVGETLYPLLSWIWAAGVALMLIYTAASYLMLRRKMAEATLLRENIWQCEQVDSPFVLGFIKPRIYLPYNITDSDMANVIAHENAHIHRKDHWWKPMGFILLSIHWFNPVLWLAYILLCRDIEGACDEKVIRHMEKAEMRAYSTALLNCSVNRRMIAACPLAFGEVGVKERVKTVMNYKKPAFWIVIVAIALCVVVAVCFLTNPKDNGLEVGNPQMLEFPGVEWGMTPEEVKEALDISEDMIIKEEHIDYEPYEDEFRLTISGAQYFGIDADNLIFRFWEYDNQTVLYTVQVTYASETNMAVVRDNLIGIYGPGTDYGFTNYELHKTPVETEYTVQSYIDWNHSNSIEFGKTIEENAKNPNPTDEINHRWASTAKGSEVISKQDLEAIIQAFGDDVGTYADRDTVLEYLDKKVLVTIRCRDGYTVEDVAFRPAVVFAAPYITNIMVARESLSD